MPEAEEPLDPEAEERIVGTYEPSRRVGILTNGGRKPFLVGTLSGAALLTALTQIFGLIEKAPWASKEGAIALEHRVTMDEQQLQALAGVPGRLVAIEGALVDIRTELREHRRDREKP